MSGWEGLWKNEYLGSLAVQLKGPLGSFLFSKEQRRMLEKGEQAWLTLWLGCCYIACPACVLFGLFG